MAERSRGPIGGGAGTLLDTLTVRITCDLSGLRAGIAEAIAQIRALKGAIASQVGGVSLANAMNLALVAPVVIATARLGQMRNEVRLLTTELRAAAALSYGSGAAGRSLGALVPYAAVGGLPTVLNATARQGRAANGQFGRRAFRVEGDDLAEAAGAHTAAGYAAMMAASRARFDERDPMNAPEPEGAAVGGRRRRNWFQRTFSPTRARRAFQVAQRESPGMDEAMEGLGMSANRLGRTARGGIGSAIGRTLGLTGLGSVFASLLSLGADLVTLLGGALAGAFAALATPIGLVVVAITALIALFVASNWSGIRDFVAFLQHEWAATMGPSFARVMDGARDVLASFLEAFHSFAPAFQEAWPVVAPIIGGIGQLIIRTFGAAADILAGFLHAIAEVVRAIVALLHGDLEGALHHLGDAFEAVFRGILDALGTFIPEIRNQLTGLADWVVARFNDMGRAAQNFWNNLNHPSNGAVPGDPNASGRRGLHANDNNKITGVFGVDDVAGGPGTDAIGGETQITPAMQRATQVAQGFGQAISNAFGQAVLGAGKFSDILKQLILQLAEMVLRAAVLEPMAQGITGWLNGAFSQGSKGGGGGGILGGIVDSVFGGFGGGGDLGGKGFGGGKMSSNDNGLHVDARAFIDATGADAAAIARLEAGLMRRDAQLPGQIRATVGDMRQRGRL